MRVYYPAILWLSYGPVVFWGFNFNEIAFSGPALRNILPNTSLHFQFIFVLFFAFHLFLHIFCLDFYKKMIRLFFTRFFLTFPQFVPILHCLVYLAICSTVAFESNQKSSELVFTNIIKWMCNIVHVQTKTNSIS